MDDIKNTEDETIGKPADESTIEAAISAAEQPDGETEEPVEKDDLDNQEENPADSPDYKTEQSESTDDEADENSESAENTDDGQQLEDTPEAKSAVKAALNVVTRGEKTGSDGTGHSNSGSGTSVHGLQQMASETYREDIQKNGRIRAIDGKLKAPTEAGKIDKTASILISSLRSRIPLTGILSEIDTAVNGNPYGIVYFHGFKIIIPASQFGIDYSSNKGNTQSEIYHTEKAELDKRLGSEIDFVVVGNPVKGFTVDTAKRIAAASRKTAMKIRQFEYWINDSSKVTEGSSVEARIVRVNMTTVLTEIGGLEVLIPAENVSWSHVSNIPEQFPDLCVGSRVALKILSVDDTDQDHIQVQSSIKAFRHNYQEEAFNTYNQMIENRQKIKAIGKVSDFYRGFYYIQLENGAECSCPLPVSEYESQNVMVGDTVAVKIFRTIMTESGNYLIYGNIARVIKAGNV